MEPDWSVGLAKCVASHFPGGSSDGGVADLGFAGLRIDCLVPSVQERGGLVSASLSFYVSGPAFGEHSIFASMSGYGKSVPEAVITGGCNWTCTAGPLLRAAFAGEALPDDAIERRVAIHGQVFRVVASGIDRALGTGDGPAGDWHQVRARYRTGWMLDDVLASGTLPLVDRPTLLSVFVGASAGEPVVEVRVSGCVWPAGAASVHPGQGAFAGGVALLREIAVLLPEGPAPALSRSAIETTLSGCVLPFDGMRPGATWRGWRAHGGELGPPLGDAAVASLEETVGPLPDDYRAFVRDVAATGAGPGYGLLSPAHPAQLPLAAGDFPWTEAVPERDLPPRGALVLAHAGDGVTWLLILRGPRRGEVWVDASGSDGHVGPVAPSFSQWYRDWLAGLVHNAAPFVQWDASHCAMPHLMSKFLWDLEAREGVRGDAAMARLRQEIGPGALVTVAAGDGNAFRHGEDVDPCEGCTVAALRMGLPESMWAFGSLPLQARPAPAPPLTPEAQPEPAAWWKRWFG